MLRGEKMDRLDYYSSYSSKIKRSIYSTALPDFLNYMWCSRQAEFRSFTFGLEFN